MTINIISADRCSICKKTGIKLIPLATYGKNQDEVIIKYVCNSCYMKTEELLENIFKEK